MKLQDLNAKNATEFIMLALRKKLISAIASLVFFKLYKNLILIRIASNFLITLSAAGIQYGYL